MASSGNSAPYLVWPVARREYYIAIGVSMAPAMLWGFIIFGWRAFVSTLFASVAGVGTHLVLKRLTTRGKRLLLAHSLLSVMIYCALCAPIWETWEIVLGAIAVVCALFLAGGPGRERVHAGVVAAVVLGLVLRSAPVAPTAAPHGTWPPQMANNSSVLARDRLFMGDIRNFPPPPPLPAFAWPASRELGGNDALLMAKPATVATRVLNVISGHVERVGSDLSISGAVLDAGLEPTLEPAMAFQLPDLDLVLLGVNPATVGTASAVAVLLGGLYLAYRNILRPKSAITFVAAFTLGMLLFALTPGAIGHLRIMGSLKLWQTHAGLLVTLLSYLFFSSDALFAATFVLALPSTEPITPQGRRWFLLAAGLLGAYFLRFELPVPPGSTALLILQPVAPLFDRIFARRSWLARH